MAGEYVTFDDLVRFHREVIAPDLTAQLAALETRLDARFERVDARFEREGDRQSCLSSQFPGQAGLPVPHLVDRRFDHLEDVLESLDDRMQKGFNRNRDELVAMRRDMVTGFNKLHALLDRIAGNSKP